MIKLQQGRQDQRKKKLAIISEQPEQEGLMSAEIPQKQDAKANSREAVSPCETEIDKGLDNCLRPKTLEEYIGQTQLKESLKISIEAAKRRAEPLDHLLFYGPPGLGKTTLSTIIANETGSKIITTSAPALEKPRDIIGILMSLKPNEFLFIDEIHRLNKVAEEILYPAMEDFSIDRTIGKGQSAKTLRVPIQKFTLIGATTKAGSLSSPLRDRFGIAHRLEYYTKDELKQIVKRTARILNAKITEESLYIIASRSRGTPRITNRILKRVRDFAQVRASGTINPKVAVEALEMLNIDEYGLDLTDRALLKLIIEKHDGGPVGIETLASSLGEDLRTIEDVYEPYLMQIGFISRTQRGRKASPAAYKHLGFSLPAHLKAHQQRFFDV